MHFIFLSFTHIFNLILRKRFLNMRSFRCQLHALPLRSHYLRQEATQYPLQIDIQIFDICRKRENSSAV